MRVGWTCRRPGQLAVSRQLGRHNERVRLQRANQLQMDARQQSGVRQATHGIRWRSSKNLGEPDPAVHLIGCHRQPERMRKALNCRVYLGHELSAVGVDVPLVHVCAPHIGEGGMLAKLVTTKFHGSYLEMAAGASFNTSASVARARAPTGEHNLGSGICHVWIT